MHAAPRIRRKALATAFIAAACAAGVQAQDKPVVFKMSSWVPAQHPLNPALQAKLEDIDAGLRTKWGMTTEQTAVGQLD